MERFRRIAGHVCRSECRGREGCGVQIIYDFLQSSCVRLHVSATSSR
jgi:hypothetical protein